MDTSSDIVHPPDPGPDYLGTAEQQSGSSVPAFLYGLSAALLGSLVWAAIYIVANLELGFLAWGIGWAVGGVMLWIKKVGSMELAISAVFCTLLGLATGKILSYEYGTVPEAKEAIAEDPDWMPSLIHCHLKRSGRYSAALFEWRENVDSPDSPPKELLEELSRFAAEEQRLLAGKDRSFVDREATHLAKYSLAGLPFMERYDITAFDLLWLLLGLGTAWRLTKAGHPQVSQVPDRNVGERSGHLEE